MWTAGSTPIFIVFGLTAALKDAITVKNGRVEQRSFKDFRMLRMDEMPAIEVYIVPSDRQTRAQSADAAIRQSARTDYTPDRTSLTGAGT